MEFRFTIKESDIFGRDADKEAIIKLLLSEDASPNHMGVIAITGMGRVGKTTLPQIVYNDSRVKKNAFILMHGSVFLITSLMYPR